jgi:hypothetical protein
MKHIQNAHVHERGVVLYLPRRVFQIRFRAKPGAVGGALIHTQSSILRVAWKPNAVLPRDFQLPVLR